MALIAQRIWSPYGSETPFIPDFDGVPTKAGGVVTVSRGVVQAGDDTYYDHVADNGVKISGITHVTSTAEGDVIRVEQIVPGAIYKWAYAGTALAAGDIGAKRGIDGDGKVDSDNTSQLLFTIRGYNNTTGYAYVSIDPDLIVGYGAVV